MEVREMILRIKRGDDGVFSEIIDEYSSYLATVIRSVCALNNHDIEDLIAETMLSLWKNAKNLNESLSFKAYLAAIARNKAIDYARKKRVELIELDTNFSDRSDIENDFLRREMTDFLSGKIDEMGEPDKSILCLKYYQGLKSKEIAEKLNMSQSTVNTRLSRQRSRLKKILLKMEA